MRRIWNSSPVSFLREIVGMYFEFGVARSAAALAYFFILSMCPFLICINFFIGFFQMDTTDLFQYLDRIIPGESLTLLTDYLSYISANRSSTLLAAGIGTILISASAAIRTLLNVMDNLHGHRPRSGIRRLLVSVGLSLLFLITVYLSLVVILTGDWFLKLMELHFPAEAAALLHLPAFTALWRWIRYLFLFCFVLLLVLLLYRVGAPRDKPRAPLLTGGVFAALAIVGASAVFSFMIGRSSRYALIYGSLASVIILLVWLYLCGNILILGNVINCAWYRRKRKRYLQRLEQEAWLEDEKDTP